MVTFTMEDESTERIMSKHTCGLEVGRVTGKAHQSDYGTGVHGCLAALLAS